MHNAERTARNNTARNNTARHNTAWNSTAQHSIALQNTALQNIAQHKKDPCSIWLGAIRKPIVDRMFHHAIAIDNSPPFRKRRQGSSICAAAGAYKNQGPKSPINIA
jgi:hypothetical protein